MYRDRLGGVGGVDGVVVERVGARPRDGGPSSAAVSVVNSDVLSDLENTFVLLVSDTEATSDGGVICVDTCCESCIVVRGGDRDDR
jgi:hypothetical protein